MLIIVASIVALGAIAVAAIVVFGGHSTTASPGHDHDRIVRHT